MTDNRYRLALLPNTFTVDNFSSYSDVNSVLLLQSNSTGVLSIKFSLPRDSNTGYGTRLTAITVCYIIQGGSIETIDAILYRHSCMPDPGSGTFVENIVKVNTQDSGFLNQVSIPLEGEVCITNPFYDIVDECRFHDLQISFEAGAMGATLRVICAEAKFDWEFNA